MAETMFPELRDLKDTMRQPRPADVLTIRPAVQAGGNVNAGILTQDSLLYLEKIVENSPGKI